SPSSMTSGFPPASKDRSSPERSTEADDLRQVRRCSGHLPQERAQVVGSVQALPFSEKLEELQLVIREEGVEGVLAFDGHGHIMAILWVSARHRSGGRGRGRSCIHERRGATLWATDRLRDLVRCRALRPRVVVIGDTEGPRTVCQWADSIAAVESISG